MLLALSGCATAPEPEFSPAAYLAGGSNAQVCEVVIYAYPQYSELGRAEASRRGINCADYQQAAAALQQQRATAAAGLAPDTMGGAILRGIGQGLRPTSPSRPPVTCSSISQGGVLSTTCN